MVGEGGWRERYERMCGERKGYKEGMLWVLKYYMGKEVVVWIGKGMGKLMKEIEREKNVKEVEEKEIEWEVEKNERRKGWKKYIWE
jgi:hypothetical protein